MSYIWQILHAIGRILIVLNGKILKKLSRHVVRLIFTTLKMVLLSHEVTSSMRPRHLSFSGHGSGVYEPAVDNLPRHSAQVHLGQSRSGSGRGRRTPDHARRRDQPDRQILPQKSEREN